MRAAADQCGESQAASLFGWICLQSTAAACASAPVPPWCTTAVGSVCVCALVCCCCAQEETKGLGSSTVCLPACLRVSLPTCCPLHRATPLHPNTALCGGRACARPAAQQGQPKCTKHLRTHTTFTTTHTRTRGCCPCCCFFSYVCGSLNTTVVHYTTLPAVACCHLLLLLLLSRASGVFLLRSGRG